jgi:ribonuclease P protein component
MLSAAHRFHGRGSLRYVYQHGKTARGPQLSLRYHLNPKRKTYRLAVVVGKKTAKSAVARNRIRRRIYELIAANDDKITQPYDIVVTVFSPTIGQIPFEQLSHTIDSLLRQAGIQN